MKPSLPKTIIILTIVILIALPSTHQYAFKISNFNTTATSSFTNFNQDLSQCKCDISTACDTFCCCDTQCDSTTVSKWSASNWCAVNTVQIQKMCSQIGSKGFSSFEDLGCVMFSNRGAIGSYYVKPSDYASPNVDKFSTRYSNPGIGAQSSLLSSSKYQQGSNIKIKRTKTINGTNTTTSQQLSLWIPIFGQGCIKGSIPLQISSYTYQCIYSIHDSKTCETVNENIYGSLIGLCDDYNCTNIVGSTTASASTYSSGSCSNVIRSVTLNIVLDYNKTTSQYKISNSSSLVFGNAAIVTDKYVTITSIITITSSSGNVKSGNPGYAFGKNVQYGSGAIYNFKNSNGLCLTTNTTSNELAIKFGVNETFTCLANGANPCQTDLIIDEIATGDAINLKKYASGSQDLVDISGLSGELCSYQSYTMYILYSYSGWVMDPQFYILDSKITGEKSSNPNANIAMKQLRVKWIEIKPSEIISPPSNNFYTYFQYLWLPLRSKFYKAYDYVSYGGVLTGIGLAGAIVITLL